MDTATTFWLFIAACGASAVGGMLGMASGIFIVPLLTFGFGLDIRVAIAASLVSVIACSCSSAAPFLHGRLINVRLAIVLETATTLGALTGVFLIGLVSTALLYGLFALILAISAQQMLVRRNEPVPATVANTANPANTATTAIVAAAPDARSWATRLRLHGSLPDRASGQDVPYHVGHVPLGLVLMYGAGLVSALLGIGSGVLKIPAMDTALRLPLKVSSGTSTFMIGVTAAASAGAYFMRGDIDTAIAGPVALGSVVGALAGARLLMRLSGDRLRIAFVVVLALLAIQMFVTAVGVPSLESLA